MGVYPQTLFVFQYSSIISENAMLDFPCLFPSLYGMVLELHLKGVR